MIVTVIPIIIDSVRIGDTWEEEDINKKEVEGHLIEKITRVEVIWEEEDPWTMEDHLMTEDPLTMEDSLMMEDPLIIEDPQEMKDHPEDLEDKDRQAHQNPLDLCTL